MSATDSKRKKVVIVGGGFGGMNVARKLGNDKNLDIVILDKHNYHLFQPLLYQVATAGLSPGDIAIPIRSVLSKYENIQVLMGEVQSVDLVNRMIETEIEKLEYDYLIMSCGSQHGYFGHEAWEPFAPGLKTVEQATEIRRRVLTAFEMAERETDAAKVSQLLTFVVIGGGPTGVELAGSIGELAHFSLSKDFRHIDPTQTRIVLIEAGPRILAQFSESLSKKAAHDLEKLGVTILTSTRVTDVQTDRVILGNEKIRTATTIWAAGVRPPALNEKLGVPLDKLGRVLVENDMSIKGHPEVFVIGDQACFMQDGKPLPGLAPVAIQQGRWAARLIAREVSNGGAPAATMTTGTTRQPFHYFDKGQMATIGRRRAIAETNGIKISGVLAWYAWLLVHIYYLIGFKNRVLVLLQWFWSYVTYKRGSQLIVQKEWRSFQDQGTES